MMPILQGVPHDIGTTFKNIDWLSPMDSGKVLNEHCTGQVWGEKPLQTIVSSRIKSTHPSMQSI